MAVCGSPRDFHFEALIWAGETSWPFADLPKQPERHQIAGISIRATMSSASL
jgi:hypothetical protein